MPFGIQPIHLIVIIVIALLIFGPKRLPEIGRGLGRAINEFRYGTREMAESFRDEVASKPSSGEAPAATPLPGQPTTAHENSCTNCGASNPPDARFCNNCGAQLVAG